MLFAMALEQPAGERAAFVELEFACADDLALRRRVEALLAAHEHPDPRLAEPGADLPGNIRRTFVARRFGIMAASPTGGMLPVFVLSWRPFHERSNSHPFNS